MTTKKRARTIADVIDARVTEIVKAYPPDVADIVANVMEDLSYDPDIRRIVEQKIKSAFNVRKG